MKSRAIVVVLVVASLVVAAGCRKLDTGTPGTIATERAVSDSEIPLEMGNLVAVTTSEQWPGLAQLWFERPDKTITMIAVDMKNLRMSDVVVKIPRR